MKAVFAEERTDFGSSVSPASSKLTYTCPHMHAHMKALTDAVHARPQTAPGRKFSFLQLVSPES